MILRGLTSKILHSKLLSPVLFQNQNNFLLEIFFTLVAQENNAFSCVSVTRELLFSKLLRDVPEKCWFRRVLNEYILNPMADTKTVKTKIKSVDNIRKITKAMEMVARSKMKKAIDRALGVRPYAFFALEFLVNFSYHASATSPFFRGTEGGKILIVEIAANKGLCGGYNANVFRELRKYVRTENISKNVSLAGNYSADYVSVGKYATQHVRTQVEMSGGSILHSYNTFSDDVTLKEARELAEYIKGQYASGLYRKVVIVSTHFKSVLSQKPIVRQLLPLSPEVFKNQIAQAGGEQNWMDAGAMHLERDWSRYVIEPSVEEIFTVIIPELVVVQVYQAILDALASEHASRMMAMKSATENADKLGDELLLSFNHIRQEGITRELSEIAAGANALGA